VPDLGSRAGRWRPSRRLVLMPLILGCVVLVLGLGGWACCSMVYRSYVSSHGLAAEPDKLAALVRWGADSLLGGIAAAIAGLAATTVLQHIASRYPQAR